MSRRAALPIMAALLCASVALNAWLLSSKVTSVTAAGAGAAGSAAVARPEAAAEAASSSFAALMKSVEAARRAPAAAAPANQPPGDPQPHAAHATDGRVTRALLDDVQCRIAREKATDAWRREADGLRAALMRDQAPDPERHARSLAERRAELADVLGVDEGDGRVAPLALRLEGLHEEAVAEVRRLVALDPPDWRAALDVVRGLYRQEDAAVARAFDAAAADDWRLNEVDSRAAPLAIGASLVGVPWSSVDDRTPPSAP